MHVVRQLVLKKVDSHIKSSKHSKGKARLASKEKREGDIISMLKKYDKDVHPVGEGLSEEVRVRLSLHS